MNDRDATVDWLLSTQGRIARIVAGSLLIILGLGIIGGFLGVLLLIIGAVPIASAAYGAFLLGPLFGRDIYGRRGSEQPADEDGDGDEPRAERDEDEGPRKDRSEDEDEPRKEPDPDWSAPPLARAERPEGQGPRTKDLRAEDDSAAESSS
jgi:hypothetical protein